MRETNITKTDTDHLLTPSGLCTLNCVIQVIQMLVYLLQADSSRSLEKIIFFVDTGATPGASFSQMLLWQWDTSNITCQDNNQANISFQIRMIIGLDSEPEYIHLYIYNMDCKAVNNVC